MFGSAPPPLFNHRNERKVTTKSNSGYSNRNLPRGNEKGEGYECLLMNLFVFQMFETSRICTATLKNLNAA